MPMEIVSAKLGRTHHDARHDYGGHLAHWCPACKELHEIAVDRPFRNGARWTWDGNGAAPSFSPSMNIRVGPYPQSSKKAGHVDVCHYFVRAGRIEYLGDCTHVMAGQTVDMPDLPESVHEQVRVSQRYHAVRDGA